MIVFTIIAALLMTAAIVLLLDLTPERITDDMMRIVSPKQSLKDRVRIAQGKKKSRKLSQELQHIRDAMTATGKGGRFTFVCAGSLVGMISGVVLAVLFGNPFLTPILGVACCLLPFVYAKSAIRYYDKHIETEMETALSIISTSYIRSDDILSAVKENLSYLKPPVKELFQAFVGDATAVSSDIKTAIGHLRAKVDNDIFREWCDAVIQCQDDRTLKDTLLPIVCKLTDVRIVNNELRTTLQSVRSEYYTMVCLLIGNIPLLYMLNKDWYHTLMDTTPGKVVIAICGLVILVTARLMLKYTQPIQYKR